MWQAPSGHTFFTLVFHSIGISCARCLSTAFFTSESIYLLVFVIWHASAASLQGSRAGISALEAGISIPQHVSEFFFEQNKKTYKSCYKVVVHFGGRCAGETGARCPSHTAVRAAKQDAQ